MRKHPAGGLLVTPCTDQLNERSEWNGRHRGAHERSIDVADGDPIGYSRQGSPPATRSHDALPAVPPLSLASLVFAGGTADYSEVTLRVVRLVFPDTCFYKWPPKKNFILILLNFSAVRPINVAVAISVSLQVGRLMVFWSGCSVFFFTILWFWDF